MVFGLLIFAMFVPFYIVSLIISEPQALIVQVVTYFPLTAPVTAMLRNAFGTLEPAAAGVVIAELFLAGVLVLQVAVGLFRYGAIVYTDKLNLRATLGRRRSVSAGK